MFRKTLLSLSALAALTASAFTGSAFADDAQTVVPGATATVAIAPAAMQPKGQAALQGVLDQLLQGKTDFAEIAPMTRLNLLQQQGMIPALTMRLQGFGGLQSVSFAGIQNGTEIYDVRFADASMIWGIVMGQDGRIAHIRWKFH
ncbi:hypothetical protein [Methyloferula stellata]|uniref:hypothetical protein n=1 Tax=Methyloferula stellata TaxID=876270 RepID=UPI000371811A|nr:hypothetical protein [Methyloferula stellata]